MRRVMGANRSAHRDVRVDTPHRARIYPPACLEPCRRRRIAVVTEIVEGHNSSRMGIEPPGQCGIEPGEKEVAVYHRWLHSARNSGQTRECERHVPPVTDP